MKFTVGMKCPDALLDAIDEAVQKEIDALGDDSQQMHDIRFENGVSEAKNLARRWFKYGEFIRVTIDTHTETCIVETV